MPLEAPEPAETTVQADPHAPPRQPYPGLRPFDENEQRLFFGRDHQVKEILKRLQQTYFAVVIGGSGSGKSSIVNAGVIPALRKKQLRASGDFWLTACFTPKDRPLRHLATALAAFVEHKSGQSAEEVVEEVEQTLLEINSLGGFLQRYRTRLKLEEGQAPESRNNANLLIVCDQFEEIFREQNRDNPETRQLVDLIIEAHRNRNDYPQLYAIIGMRSEDLHHCAQYIDLPNVINDASFLTRRLDENEIASAIIEPIRLVLRLRGIRPKRYQPIEVDPWPFDVELLRRLNLAVSSLAFNPDHLPLLQHLLSVLWRYVETTKPLLRDDAIKDPSAAAAFRITADDLAVALGFAGIAAADEFARRNKLSNSWVLERALDRAAEGVMPTEDRLKRIAGMMFRLLALVNDRGIYTRRWTSRAEIAEVTRDMTAHERGGTTGLANRLVQRLRGKRSEPDDRPATEGEIEAVISAFKSPYPFLYVREGRDGKIDVSHEAFIRNWSTFRLWLSDERTLALAFEALRTAYEKWREKLRDPHRWWLGRLSAICGDRLSGEKLQQMRDWWNRRRYNAAWAARYAGGVESQDADTEQRQPRQIGDETLALLRRYYRKSYWLRVGTRAGPVVLLLVLLFFVGWAFDSAQKAANSEIQLAAWRPYSAAKATSDQIAKRQSDLEKNELGAKALIFESAVEMEYVRNIRDVKAENVGLAERSGSIEKAKAWLLKQYQKLRPSEDFGLVEFASAQIDKTARDTMGSAMWPVSMSSSHGPVLSGQAARVPDKDDLICPDRTKEYLRRQGADADVDIGVARHTLAPFEPPGGRRLSMVQSPETSLNFFLVSPTCDAAVDLVYTLGIAPNSEVKVDSDLRLIVANSRTGSQTWLYRFDWVRRCKKVEPPKNQVSQTCDVDFVPIVVSTVHDGAYEIIDSSRVTTARDEQYQLRRDYGPIPLNSEEAKAARKEFDRGKSSAGQSRDKGCDGLPSHVAVLVAEKKEGQYDTLHIFDANAGWQCGDYAGRGKGIIRFDLGSYFIQGVAFAREMSSTKNVPDFILLQGQEEGVIYKFAWNPNKVRSMLCETLRKQNQGSVPSPEALPISIDVKSMLSKDERVKYPPAEVCGMESDLLAKK